MIDTTVERLTTDAVLINVADENEMNGPADFPYGLALIVGYMRDQGLNTKMLQYPTWEKEEYLQPILDSPAYLYGFQVGYSNYEEIRDLAKLIKQSNPKAKIVFGGPFVVSMYVELLKNDPDLDAVVLGEGEYTIVELVQRLKEGDPDWILTQGLARLDDEGEVVMNPHRGAIPDMNVMPFAARDGMSEARYDDEGKYMLDVRITTSRGCTSNCSFCAVNLNSQWQNAKQWRGRSHIDVVDEIQEVVEKYNVQLFNLQDSSFDDPGTLGQERTRLFCEEILKRGLEISMKAYFRAHAVKDDPDSIELYKLYKEAGIDVIIVGAEAGSDYELEIYAKDADLADNFRCFEVLDELDLFFVSTGFIMFGPYSTMDTLRQNIRFLWENNRTPAAIFNALILTPGAVLVDFLAQEEGRILPTENFWDLPGYTFEDPRIRSLAEGAMGLRTNYPHVKDGAMVQLVGHNIISRLKNKMNKPIARACANEIDDFVKIFYRNFGELNDLAYLGFVENLNRLEKDGPDARLDFDPYFGKPWAAAIGSMDDAFERLTATIKANGFGLGGVVYENPRQASRYIVAGDLK